MPSKDTEKVLSAVQLRETGEVDDGGPSCAGGDRLLGSGLECEDADAPLVLVLG